MKKKIFLYYIILVVIGITITGFFVSELTQSLYKGEVEQRLKSAAVLIDYQLAGRIGNGEKIDYNQAAKAYASLLIKSVGNNSVPYVGMPSASDGASQPRANTQASPGSEAFRITFISFDGKVLGESEANYQAMENHLGRKEVQAAVHGKTGMDIRTSKTLKLDFLYVAIPSSAASVVIRVSMPLVQLKSIDRTIWIYCLLGILAGLFLTSLLALRFSSSITRPVKELTRMAKEVAGGNYHKRVGVKSSDELGELASTFNDMAGELEKTIADLTDKNMKFDSIMNSMTNGIIAVDRNNRIILINAIACRLFNLDSEIAAVGEKFMEVIRNHRINELLKKAVEENLSSIDEITMNAAEEKVFRVYTNPIMPRDGHVSSSGGILSIMDITNIKKLEQIRTDFVSNVTHELKTPLTSIRGFVETLRDGAINDASVAGKFLEIIDIEAERLYMLINDILQLSEIETRQKDTDIGMNNLKEIVSDVVSILEQNAEKKHVVLNMDVDGNIDIQVNRNRIKQMLINLIDNAINYNVENGSVLVKASKSEGRLTISVKDTGIGIAQQHLSRIFERFYRVDKGRSRNMGGTGLGLSIVKHIVNLYSGDIRVESEPGRGSEFIIRLPL